MFGCFVSSVNNVSSAQRNCETTHFLCRIDCNSVMYNNDLVNTRIGDTSKSHERVLNELKINVVFSAACLFSH